MLHRIRYLHALHVAVLLLAAPLVPVLLCACGRPAMPASSPHPLLGQPLPAFQRATLQHELFDTTRFRGSPIVVKFFASYCEPCKRTLPAVERLHTQHPDVRFVGICEDESPSVALEMVRTYQLTFPVVMDPSRALMGRFRVRDMPVTFLVGSDGIIRWIGGPDQTEADLRAALEAVK